MSGGGTAADDATAVDMSDPSHQSGRRAGEVAVAVVLVGYFALLHVLLVAGRWPRVTIALVVAPWVVALASLAMHRLARGRALAALVAIGAVAALVVERSGTVVAETMLVENVAFTLLLAGLFSASLLGPGEALVTRLARIAHGGDIDDAVVAYSRRATVAWAVFFVACAATSVTLFVLVSREAWSVFANLLYWPLVAAMFVGEYAVRRLVLADHEHVSLMTSIRTFTSNYQGLQQKGLR